MSPAISPKARASLPMRDCDNDYFKLVRSKDDIKREAAKNGPSKIGVENLKAERRISYEYDDAVQFIEKANCRTDASFCIPSGCLVCILNRVRMQAYRPPHQSLILERSIRRASSQVMV
jgi:hypothetical protein